MIIWRGLGIVVPIIAFFVCLCVELLVRSHFGANYYQREGWPIFLALSISGVICWALGTMLEKRPGKVVIEKETGKEIILKNSHDLFFIPIKFWGLIMIVGGAVLFFTRINQG